MCRSLAHELQRAKVNHAHSKQAVPCYRKAKERGWDENGVRFSGLTIKSAGTMGGSDRLRKLNQCDENCLHLAIFKVFCFEGRGEGASSSSALHRHPKLMGQDFQPPNQPPTPPFTGFLWQLRPLVLGAEPAAAAHRGPLHPPDPAGLARAHRHPHGAPRVPGQVRLSAVSGGGSVAVCPPVQPPCLALPPLLRCKRPA